MKQENGILDDLLAELQINRSNSNGVDYVSANRRDVFQVKLRRQGLRDVRDAMLELASRLGATPRKIDRAFVLISLTRSSPERVREEWNAAKAIMLPDIAKRLFLIAIVNGKTVVDPVNPELQELARKFAIIVAKVEGPKSPQEAKNAEALWPNAATARQTATSWKHVEIEKVLLTRWLLKEGTIKIGALQAKVGCSYPTVQHAIRTLARLQLIGRGSGGSVELTKYPRDRWAALISSAKQVYTPIEYVDVTGDRHAPEALLSRLQSIKKEALPELGLGGVLAGRHWNSDFDLNGTPRLDLVLHAPAEPCGRLFNLDFIRQLDPALKIRRDEHAHRSPVLVVHPIHRHDSLFSENLSGQIPWADPVETVLHLIGMGLTAQAGDLVSRFQPKTRLPENSGRK